MCGCDRHWDPDAVCTCDCPDYMHADPDEPMDAENTAAT